LLKDCLSLYQSIVTSPLNCCKFAFLWINVYRKARASSDFICLSHLFISASRRIISHSLKFKFLTSLYDYPSTFWWVVYLNTKDTPCCYCDSHSKSFWKCFHICERSGIGKMHHRNEAFIITSASRSIQFINKKTLVIIDFFEDFIVLPCLSNSSAG
jgi:hypothetical protein